MDKLDKTNETVLTMIQENQLMKLQIKHLHDILNKIKSDISDDMMTKLDKLYEEILLIGNE